MAVLTAACGTDSDRFRIEGRFRNLNQGEFYLYSPDGGINGIDTIRVSNGRFSYETELRTPATFVIIFPNFSEQAVIGTPGTTAKVKGDASHLKEMEVEGSEENKLLTRFRQRASRLTPPEVTRAAAEFIEENPQTLAAEYLLRRYYILAPEADYAQAARLAGLIAKQNPDNGRIVQLGKQLKSLKNGQHTQLPNFTATDIQGRRVSRNDLRKRVNVVTAWVSWNYQSTEAQRRLKRLQKEHAADLAILSICLDADVAKCRQQVVERDSLKWSTVCDGRMWQTPLVQQFGFATQPANIIATADGKIVARNLDPQKLIEKIESLLK